MLILESENVGDLFDMDIRPCELGWLGSNRELAGWWAVL